MNIDILFNTTPFLFPLIFNLLSREKFWEEPLHKLTANNLFAMVTVEHKQSKPTAEQGSPNKVEP
jgi:hypothetical protein